MKFLPVFSAFHLVLSLIIFSSASGWSIKSSPAAQRPSVSQLEYRRDDEDQDFVGTVAVAKPFPLQSRSLQLPSALDLPRHTPPREEIEKAKLLWDMEMHLGRLAMVTAMFLLVGEMMTGQSMLDQVSGIFH